LHVLSTQGAAQALPAFPLNRAFSPRKSAFNAGMTRFRMALYPAISMRWLGPTRIQPDTHLDRGIIGCP
jgi:hypothetical protein